MKKSISVFLGDIPTEVGVLSYEIRGARRSTSFCYSQDWLQNPKHFPLSPDLPLVPGHQFHPNKDHNQSAFFTCFADAEPDGWGQMVIKRDYARQRKKLDSSLAAVGLLDDFDYLLWINDYSRLGAIRFRNGRGVFLRPDDGEGQTPLLIDLPNLLSASKAVEENKETARDLEYLRGNGTSLGGLRPKCSIIDEDGSLAIGKFPSISDTRSIVHGEVLALTLAKSAGINAASARVIETKSVPVALISRFDRCNGQRLMYLSARSLIQAMPNQQYTYVDIANAIRENGSQVSNDLEELWRRMIFNILINNVDDHLNNHGFLHQANNQWRLAPAFDLNPFPDKQRLLKTWISEESGDNSSIADAVASAPLFELSKKTSGKILQEVRGAILGWKKIANQIGMSPQDIKNYEPAFEHPEL